MKMLLTRVCAIFAVFCVVASGAWALDVAAAPSLTVPSVFSDHMVLQQQMAVPVWGTAEPGSTVTVILGRQKRTAKTRPDGKWRVKLSPLTAGGPFEMIITDGRSTKTITDILVGEVWLCSGQSNMELRMTSVINAREEIAAANDPQLRFFTVKKESPVIPRTDAPGIWEACTPKTTGPFSATAYFFGRSLRGTQNVPVGLINDSWGGTTCEAWADPQALAANRKLRPLMSRLVPFGKLNPATDREEYLKRFVAMDGTKYLDDPGNKGVEFGWAKAEFDDSAWKSMPQPGGWGTMGTWWNFDGAVWFRRSVEIPAAWAGKPLTINLGPIDDMDTTYFNGTQIGATGKETANFWSTPRSYHIPGALVKAGCNLIAVRVFDHFGSAGFNAKPEQMTLAPKDEAAEMSISLAGPWKYQIEFTDTPKPAPINAYSLDAPGILYQNMIKPLVPFAMRGVIWYQGEWNADRAYQYRTLFPAMITSWRKAWGQGNFPFLFVQLPNYALRNTAPVESTWAELRESQLLTLSLPNTAMAVTIESSDGDLHPKNKQDVGKRLAQAADMIVYRSTTHGLSPLYSSMKIEDSTIRLRFTHADGGLVAKGGEVKGFTIAGANRDFVNAQAKIDGETVVVWSDEITKPVAVRYAWADNPECNLYNAAGLPASPFRTDRWPGITDKRY